MIYTEAPRELSMSTGEALFTQRAIRRFRHDKPINDPHLVFDYPRMSKNACRVDRV